MSHYYTTMMCRPATNDWIIPCGDFHPLVVKSEVFTPGAFTLTHTAAPAFELWIPPLTAATAEGAPDLYDPYAADFLAGAIPEGSRLFNSPLTGTEADFYDDFILPTNRVVWVRALEPGAATLTYTYHKTMLGVSIRFEDTLTVTALPPALLPDYDRNGAWDETDLTAAVNKEHFNFWRNDDREETRWIAGTGDLPDIYPAADTPFNSASESPDAWDDVINGAKDWVDFFPVKLNLSDYLVLYPPSEYTYILKSEGALNVWVSSLYPDYAQWVAGALNPGSQDFNVEFLRDLVAHSGNCAVQNLNGELLLSYELLCVIRDNPHTDYALLFEGRAFSEHASALKLVIEHDDHSPVVYTEEAPIHIVPVEHMFRYHNLLSQAGKNDSTIRETDYNPDYTAWGSRDSTTDLFFVHGYNVDSSDARGWACEMFKRFYWSGSTAQFHAVHWYGFSSQIPLPYPRLKFTPDFHSNVFHAFQTAPELARRINARSGSGQRVVLMGHSLGCMLSSAAVSLHGANVGDLAILNAAVALEAYDANTPKEPNMIHQYWRVPGALYEDYTFASEWHTWYPSNHFCGDLTLRNLFANHNGARFHQFYSDTDEATGNIESTLGNPVRDAQYAAWCVQELYKGRSWDMEPTPNGALGGSKWMGWGFSAEAKSHDAAWANGRDVIQLTYSPAFRHTHPAELFTGNLLDRENFAHAHRFEILARGIPARTFSAGANELNITQANFTTSINMNRQMRSDAWLRPADEAWRHNDIREMPYASVRTFFNHITKLTQLKGN